MMQRADFKQQMRAYGIPVGNKQGTYMFSGNKRHC